MASRTLRRVLSRKYLLLREKIEADELEIAVLRKRARSIAERVATLVVEAERNRKGLAAQEEALLFAYPDWTPEGARADMPWVTIKKPKDMNLRDDLVAVMKKARSPLTVTEIAGRIMDRRNEVESEDVLVRDQLRASLSTMLRRGRETIFQEHIGRPAKWSLRRE